jgi:hypothetical protein
MTSPYTYDGGFRDAAADDHILVGAAFHHDTDDILFYAGKLFLETFVGSGVYEPRLEVRWREDMYPPASTLDGNGRTYDVGLFDVLDAKLANTGTVDYIYVLSNKAASTYVLGDGYLISRTSVDMSGANPVLSGTGSVDVVAFDDPSDEETSAAIDVDSSDNVIVAITSDSGSTSTLTLYKLRPTDLANLWTPLVWSDDAAGTMLVFDIEIDASDNIYLAGRFEGEAGIVRFPATPSDVDDHVTYSVAGGATGVTRALAVDVDNACVYATGEIDNPNDSTSELQMFVTCLASSDLSGQYEHYVDPSEFPTSLGVLGALGTSIAAGKDPYNDNDPAPYVYALGQIRHSGSSGERSSVMFRYPFGGCNVVSVEPPLSPQGFPIKALGGEIITIETDRVLPVAIEIRVFDVTGRLIARTSLPAGSRSVVIESLRSGAYFVSAELPGGRRSLGRATAPNLAMS